HRKLTECALCRLPTAVSRHAAILVPPPGIGLKCGATDCRALIRPLRCAGQAAVQSVGYSNLPVSLFLAQLLQTAPGCHADPRPGIGEGLCRCKTRFPGSVAVPAYQSHTRG